MSVRAAFFGIALVSTVACGLFGPQDTVCTLQPRYALQVTVYDSVSGGGAASGASIVARDGSFVDSVAVVSAPVPAGFFLLLGRDRPGLYQLTVRKVGYRDWTQSGIRVLSNDCGVVRVDIAVRLQPAAP